MTPVASAATESREIRVFLSSTFRDFMEERDLLVKQVFPSLRRRAQERGVEVVDVDLRWGITEEESQRGKVIGICLAEIDRCRPYFISMLGQRYGWTPQPGDYPPELLEQEELGWIRDHQGGVSVTELEILHGVLNNRKMAGRAFFYFRDSAWSQAQREPGFVCDTPEEQAKLLALKDRIRASGFPVAEDLPDPKAIAERIEADLWMLIEEQFPELDQADALEREERKHASYRQSRLGVYLGQEYVDQLEALISSGEQKIVITGESGSGKSALIANWMHRHELEHPGDVVYTHHLGCSNDANAIRPLLGRMLNTASALLLDHELISESIEVPEDWWDLTAKVAETLQDLGRWCHKTGYRWIWVLDGLDRLVAQDQQALPWLPLLIPDGVSVVISALDCPARAIVQERQFWLLQVGPLRREEQEQLIQRYLQRYTKQLDGGLTQRIMGHPQAGSPLFLRVLLEELRQCGRYETLAEQLDGCLQATSVAELYGLVLKRLEADGNGAALEVALTVLWASRAGLPEAELLSITQLTQMQWSPIDLAFQEALEHSGNRLVFGHDYLRHAVEMRYLRTEEHRRAAHCRIADWFGEQKEWDARKAEELPWQLEKGKRIDQLSNLFTELHATASLILLRGQEEVIGYCKNTSSKILEDIENALRLSVESLARKGCLPDVETLIELRVVADALEHAGLYGSALILARVFIANNIAAHKDVDARQINKALLDLAVANAGVSNYSESEQILRHLARKCYRSLGPWDQDTLRVLSSLANLYKVRAKEEEEHEGDEAYLYLNKSRGIYQSVYSKQCRLLGENHILTLRSMRDYLVSSSNREVVDNFQNLYNLFRHQLGAEHAETVQSMCELAKAHTNLAWSRRLFDDTTDFQEAESLFCKTLMLQVKRLGRNHPIALGVMIDMARMLRLKGDSRRAGKMLRKAYRTSLETLGANHSLSVSIGIDYGRMLLGSGRAEMAAEILGNYLTIRQRRLNYDHPLILSASKYYAEACQMAGNHDQARSVMTDILLSGERVFGATSPFTLHVIMDLPAVFRSLGRCHEATILSRIHVLALETSEVLLDYDLNCPDVTLIDLIFAHCERRPLIYAESVYVQHIKNLQALEGGAEYSGIVNSYCALGSLARHKGDLETAEYHYGNALAISERIFRSNHVIKSQIMDALWCVLFELGRYDAATNLIQKVLRIQRMRKRDEYKSLYRLALSRLRAGIDESARKWLEHLKTDYERMLQRLKRAGLLKQPHPSLSYLYNCISDLHFELDGKYHCDWELIIPPSIVRMSSVEQQEAVNLLANLCCAARL